MNALDIYPTFAWWICGESAADLAATRLLLEVDAPAAESARKAYFLVGDAAAFDLIPKTFDEIFVRYEPTPLRRLVLERHTRPWLKEGAQLQIQPDSAAQAAPVEEPSSEAAPFSIFFLRAPPRS